MGISKLEAVTKRLQSVFSPDRMEAHELSIGSVVWIRLLPSSLPRLRSVGFPIDNAGCCVVPSTIGAMLQPWSIAIMPVGKGILPLGPIALLTEQWERWIATRRSHGSKGQCSGSGMEWEGTTGNTVESMIPASPVTSIPAVERAEKDSGKGRCRVFSDGTMIVG